MYYIIIFKSTYAERKKSISCFSACLLNLIFCKAYLCCFSSEGDDVYAHAKIFDIGKPLLVENLILSNFVQDLCQYYANKFTVVLKTSIFPMINPSNLTSCDNIINKSALNFTEKYTKINIEQDLSLPINDSYHVAAELLETKMCQLMIFYFNSLKTNS